MTQVMCIGNLNPTKLPYTTSRSSFSVTLGSSSLLPGTYKPGVLFFKMIGENSITNGEINQLLA